MVLDTDMLLRVEVPVVDTAWTVRFRIGPNAHLQDIVGRIANLVQDVVEEYPQETALLDPIGSELGLQHFKKTAQERLYVWESNLQEAAEARLKGEKAVTQMTQMREAYFKELNHLQEQLYQKRKKERKGVEYMPASVVHFDPTNFIIDDETQQIVKDVMCLVKREYDIQIDKLILHIDALNERLQPCKMCDASTSTNIVDVRKPVTVCEVNKATEEVELIVPKWPGTSGTQTEINKKAMDRVMAAIDSESHFLGFGVFSNPACADDHTSNLDGGDVDREDQNKASFQEALDCEHRAEFDSPVSSSSPARKPNASTALATQTMDSISISTQAREGPSDYKAEEGANDSKSAQEAFQSLAETSVQTDVFVSVSIPTQADGTMLDDMPQTTGALFNITNKPGGTIPSNGMGLQEILARHGVGAGPKPKTDNLNEGLQKMASSSHQSPEKQCLRRPRPRAMTTFDLAGKIDKDIQRADDHKQTGKKDMNQKVLHQITAPSSPRSPEKQGPRAMTLSTFGRDQDKDTQRGYDHEHIGKRDMNRKVQHPITAPSSPRSPEKQRPRAMTLSTFGRDPDKETQRGYDYEQIETAHVDKKGEDGRRRDEDPKQHSQVDTLSSSGLIESLTSCFTDGDIQSESSTDNDGDFKEEASPKASGHTSAFLTTSPSHNVHHSQLKSSTVDDLPHIVKTSRTQPAVAENTHRPSSKSCRMSLPSSHVITVPEVDSHKEVATARVKARRQTDSTVQSRASTSKQHARPAPLKGTPRRTDEIQPRSSHTLTTPSLAEDCSSPVRLVSSSHSGRESTLLKKRVFTSRSGLDMK